MDFQIFIGLLLTILPFSELRGGIPVVVEYCLRHGVSIWPYFLVILILNTLLIFLIFVFLDSFHKFFMRMKWYQSFFEYFLKKVRKKSKVIEKQMSHGFGYFALALFVAVPLPVTGAWTGTLIAWILDLDRLKSFIAIALGVIIAGLIVLFLTLGLFGWIY